MTNLQKYSLKRSYNLINEGVAELFSLEKRKTENILKIKIEEIQGIKRKLIEAENWIGALLDEK